MKYVTIPKTDLTPSQLCLGTNRFGTEISQQDAFSLLDAFIDLGGNFLDTAHIYADWIAGAPKSASEKTIGRWLKRSGRRQRTVLATKGGHPDLATMHLARLSQTEIAQDINESLAHLQTDIIDLYWLHRDDPAVPVAELVETLNEQVQAGKIRYFGCSNWRPQRMAQANDYAATHEMSGFVASQPLWSLAVPNQKALLDPERLVVFDQAAYEFHRQTGLAVIPYSAQGKGFFSKLDTLGAGGLSETDRAGYSNETNTRRWSRVKQLAGKYGRPVSHVVLSYLTSQPFVTIPIAGCRTLAQLEDSVAAVDLVLTPEDLNFLVADT